MAGGLSPNRMLQFLRLQEGLQADDRDRLMVCELRMGGASSSTNPQSTMRRRQPNVAPRGWAPIGQKTVHTQNKETIKDTLQQCDLCKFNKVKEHFAVLLYRLPLRETKAAAERGDLHNLLLQDGEGARLTCFERRLPRTGRWEQQHSCRS
ncbi:unnamed protein product [Caretta caretta]